MRKGVWICVKYICLNMHPQARLYIFHSECECICTFWGDASICCITWISQIINTQETEKSWNQKSRNSGARGESAGFQAQDRSARRVELNPWDMRSAVQNQDEYNAGILKQNSQNRNKRKWKKGSEMKLNKDLPSRERGTTSPNTMRDERTTRRANVVWDHQIKKGDSMGENKGVIQEGLAV